MTVKNVLHEYAEEFEKRLRLKTFPLAVKLLEKEGDIPEGAKRPKRDLGYRLNTCQCFAMSRREGTLLAQLKEDMWCFEPVIGFGLAEPPQYFLDGYTRFPDSVKDLPTASNWAHAFPCLEVGKCIGIVSAPLMTANFEPDLVVIYCNPPQLNQLLMAIVCQQGRDLVCTLSGHAGCVHYVVPAIKTGDYQVSIPCMGDHITAMQRDDEVVFTAPMGKVEDLLLGLRHFDRYGYGMPTKPIMQPEGGLPPSYEKAAEILGMR